MGAYALTRAARVACHDFRPKWLLVKPLNCDVCMSGWGSLFQIVLSCLILTAIGIVDGYNWFDIVILDVAFLVWWPIAWGGAILLVHGFREPASDEKVDFLGGITKEDGKAKEI
jgi:hypothetical protein